MAVMMLDSVRGIQLDTSGVSDEVALVKAYEIGVANPRATTAGVELNAFLDDMKHRGTRGFKGDFVASDGTRIHFEVEFERPQRPGQHPEFERG